MQQVRRCRSTGPAYLGWDLLELPKRAVHWLQVLLKSKRSVVAEVLLLTAAPDREHCGASHKEKG